MNYVPITCNMLFAVTFDCVFPTHTNTHSDTHNNTACGRRYANRALQIGGEEKAFARRTSLSNADISAGRCRHMNKRCSTFYCRILCDMQLIFMRIYTSTYSEYYDDIAMKFVKWLTLIRIRSHQIASCPCVREKYATALPSQMTKFRIFIHIRRSENSPTIYRWSHLQFYFVSFNSKTNIETFERGKEEDDVARREIRRRKRGKGRMGETVYNTKIFSCLPIQQLIKTLITCSGRAGECLRIS